VDLAAEGFRQLFQASWLSLRREDLGPDPGGQCSRAGSATSWPPGWRRAGPTSRCPSACWTARSSAPSWYGGVDGWWRETVFTTDGFAGVSNLFAHEDPAKAWSTLAHHLLADPLTRAVGGYEHGCDLFAALAAGARELGPLTVWLRGPGQVPGVGPDAP